jgi:hypothetical protein
MCLRNHKSFYFKIRIQFRSVGPRADHPGSNRRVGSHRCADPSSTVRSAMSPSFLPPGRRRAHHAAVCFALPAASPHAPLRLPSGCRPPPSATVELQCQAELPPLLRGRGPPFLHLVLAQPKSSPEELRCLPSSMSQCHAAASASHPTRGLASPPAQTRTRACAWVSRGRSRHASRSMWPRAAACTVPMGRGQKIGP